MKFDVTRPILTQFLVVTKWITGKKQAKKRAKWLPNKALQKDGFGISEIIEKNNAVPEITEEDSQNGFIYVLSSLSPNPQIRRIKNLYKVGYCSGDITDRIKNAKMNLHT